MQLDEFLVSAITFFAVNSWSEVINTALNIYVPDGKDSLKYKILFAIIATIVVYYTLQFYNKQKDKINQVLNKIENKI